METRRNWDLARRPDIEVRLLKDLSFELLKIDHLNTQAIFVSQFNAILSR